MNVLLWVIQILLALHTAAGALWKWSNSAQGISSLRALPSGAWLAMSIVEIACAVAFIVPILGARFRRLPAAAASIIGAEMLLFCGLHLVSGSPEHGHLAYWLVVAALCTCVAVGRGRRPIRDGSSPLVDAARIRS